MKQVIEHKGVVEHIVGNVVFVTITSAGACASCRAREACGMGEAQQKTIEVHTSDAAAYLSGESVTVGVRSHTGGVAVMLGYVGALGILIAVLVLGVVAFEWSEGLSALSALAGVAVYYGILRLFRRKIEDKIHFTITKR